MVSTFQTPKWMGFQDVINGENIIENKTANPVTSTTNEIIPIGNFNKMNNTPFQVAGSVKNDFNFCQSDVFSVVTGAVIGIGIPKRWVVCNLSNEINNHMVGKSNARIIKPTQMIIKENPSEKPTTNNTKYAKPRGNARKRYKRVKYIFGLAKIVK